MPTYDYACPQCGPFDTLRSVATRNQAAVCPACASVAPRVLSGSPTLALMESDTRCAVATNERARHEPKHSGDYTRLTHPAGCGCCASDKRGATVQAPNGNKAFPGKRPWMISH